MPQPYLYVVFESNAKKGNLKKLNGIELTFQSFLRHRNDFHLISLTIYSRFVLLDLMVVDEIETENENRKWKMT